MAAENYKKKESINTITDQVAIVCYTDPLCCWSWGIQPHLQRLIEEFPGQISIDYCMGGLIPDWTEFSDPMNSIHKPAQMGPMWMEASHLTGRPIDDVIWIADAPSSSYPACIAVKTAQLQSKEAGRQLLFELSKAVMEQRKNISKTEVIARVAEQMGEEKPDIFDFDQFKNKYNGDSSRDAFRKDLHRVKLNKIGRFPTLTITKNNQQGIMITGYRPYEALREVVQQLSVF